MSSIAQPTTIGPAAYASWRATALGAVIEALEQRLVLDLMGNLEGARVPDVGCGDGALACGAAERAGLRVATVRGAVFYPPIDPPSSSRERSSIP